MGKVLDSVGYEWQEEDSKKVEDFGRRWLARTSTSSLRTGWRRSSPAQDVAVAVDQAQVLPHPAAMPQQQRRRRRNPHPPRKWAAVAACSMTTTKRCALSNKRQTSMSCNKIEWQQSTRMTRSSTNTIVPYQYYLGL